jgi:hypothetical protein
MQSIKLLLVLSILFPSCQGKQKGDGFWVKVTCDMPDEVGVPCGYINAKGDTVIAIGKYAYCYTDTFRTMAIVLKKSGEWVAIDKNEQELFEVFGYDNGPDYPSDGVFRIIRHGLIGYANTDGQIIIEPQFKCAFPFEKGKAKVSFDCQSVPEGEHTSWKSESWIYIDKNGNKIK